jgi:hypothetical protein
MPLSLDSIVIASPDQVSSDLAGETVLLSMTSAKYYGFAGVGSRIWELITTATPVRTICDTIAAEYDVSRAECEADVLGFLDQCLKSGLVEVRGGA